MSTFDPATDHGSGRTLSLSGSLALLIGAGFNIALWRFPQVARDLGATWRDTLFVGSMLLCVWGVRQVVLELRGGSSGRTTASKRPRAALPRQGMIYLLILVVLFVGSIVGRSNMLMLVFAVMVGPFIVNGWVTFMMLQRIHIDRRLPERSMAGEPISVELALLNKRRLLSSWLSRVTDLIVSGSERVAGSVMFARVPPGESRSTEYQLRPMRRGRYVLGPVSVSTRFPFGLVARRVSYGERSELLVYPRLGHLTSRWRHEERMAAELVPQREMSQGVFDDEFHGLREFRWGDNPRAIHWQTSARRNEIMVREFYQSRDQNLIVLLDLSATAKLDQQSAEQVEMALSFAATVCVEHMRQSRDAKLHIAAGGAEFTSWEGQARPSNIESMLDTLAVIEPGSGVSLSRLAEFAGLKRTPTTRVLLLTTRLEAAQRGRGSNGFDNELTAAGLGNELQVVDIGGSLDKFIQFD